MTPTSKPPIHLELETPHWNGERWMLIHIKWDTPNSRWVVLGERPWPERNPT
jgi:hypothetical protein